MVDVTGTSTSPPATPWVVPPRAAESGFDPTGTATLPPGDPLVVPPLPHARTLAVTSGTLPKVTKATRTLHSAKPAEHHVTEGSVLPVTGMSAASATVGSIAIALAGALWIRIRRGDGESSDRS